MALSGLISSFIVRGGQRCHRAKARLSALEAVRPQETSLQFCGSVVDSLAAQPCVQKPHFEMLPILSSIVSLASSTNGRCSIHQSSIAADRISEHPSIIDGSRPSHDKAGCGDHRHLSTPELKSFGSLAPAQPENDISSLLARPTVRPCRLSF
jgi:hypothetical protein